MSGVKAVQDEIAPYAESWRRANAVAMASAGPLWVVIGDSMSQGIGASAFDRGWVNQTAVELVARGLPAYRIVNFSTSGARVEDVLERQLPAIQRLGVQPDLVTVMIGSNDLIRRRYRVGLPDRFAEMVRVLPAGSVVANLPNPRTAAAIVNRQLDKAAPERGLIVADMRQRRPGSWKGKLAEDHFHPNELGYAGMAAVFADTIARHKLGLPDVRS
ncbi:SGNH/GDSL hydrolase family protein [Jatrophihabitans sp. DSM 45814]